MLAAISANTDAPTSTATEATPKNASGQNCWPAADRAASAARRCHGDGLASGVENRRRAER